MDTRPRRRVILINPAFQLSFLAYTLGIALLVSAIFFGANRYFFWKIRQEGIYLGLNGDHVFFRFVEQQQWQMDLVFIVTAAIAILILTVSGLIFSHKVAGPISRLVQFFENYPANKERRPLTFRDGDYFQEVPPAVNRGLNLQDTKRSA
jgi:hypothetical protein